MRPIATAWLFVACWCRHLVLPGDVAGSSEVLDFVANEISPLTYVSLMDQYYPWYRLATFRPWIESFPSGVRFQ